MTLTSKVFWQSSKVVSRMVPGMRMRSSLPNASTVKGDLVFDLLFVGDVDDAADQRVIVDRRETDTSMAPVMMTVFPANSMAMRRCFYEAGRPFGREGIVIFSTIRQSLV